MIYVLLVDGEYWQLREDGVLVKLTDEQYQDLEQSPDKLVLVQGNTAADSANQYDLTSGSSLAVFFAGLSRISPNLLPESGYQTAQVKSLFENIEQRPLNESELPPPIPVDAEISVAIDDGGDGFINTFEVALVNIFGETLNIFDRQPVVINLRDSDGLELEFVTTINSGQFSIPDADLSRLAQGELIVTATATDLYGNSIAATDQSIIDTLALITDDIVFNSGEVINAAEVSSMDISGSTSEIDAGQQIRIVYSDENALEIVVVTSIDADGNYSIAGVDLSALADGPINVSLSSVDIPGNTVVRETVIEKDTQAAITVNFDGDLPYHIIDLANVTLSGQVTGVEPGQVVTVTVTDSVRSVQVEAVVLADRSWQTSELNVLTFNNGPLSANVSVADLAGNPAVANTSTVLYEIPNDAAITINIEDNGDGFINMFEVDLVAITGTAANVSDRLPILIRIEDSIGGQLNFIKTSSAGVFYLDAQDLAGLAQGAVVVTASAIDFYGNTLNATDNSVIDTLAIINDDIIFNSGDVINAAEESSVDISGTTAEIDVGQQIRIVFSDQNTLEIEVFTNIIDAAGNYSALNTNLSTLAEGPIKVTLSSVDIAGNTVSRTIVINKDTIATIDVVFDGSPPYGADEIATVTVSGTTVGVDADQIVSVNITDGVNSVDTTASVLANGSWQIVGENLTGFNDGALTATASVVDLAGNPATDSALTGIDTMASIDIVTDIEAIDINALRDGDTVTINGTVTDVEVGRTVTLRFYDSDGVEQTFTTLVEVGGLWDVDVAVTDLGRFNSWQLEASVADNAGNIAVDDTPSLDVPTLVTLSEGALISNSGYADDSTIRIAGYDTLMLNAAQSNLELLESSGSLLTVVVAVDGKSLTANAGGTEVLTAVINVDDTVTVTLFQPITQPVGSDVSFSSIGVLATQNDADGTSEIVAVNIPIIIRESITFTVDDSYSAVEQVITSGNVFDNDVLLEGPLTIVKVEIAGATYDISELAPTIIANIDTKGSLTIASDGSWSFIAARNLDNTVLQQMTFSYSALDQDSDFDTSNVVITIADGVGGIFSNDTVLVTESDYDIFGSVVRDFSIQAGTDDLDPALIRFSSSQTDLLDALGYSSAGITITYTLSADGKILFADAMGAPVFNIALTAVAGTNGNLDASASFTQTLPFDHQVSDALAFPIAIQAEDNDGTISSSQATLKINDGNEPTTSAVAGAVDETDVPAGLFVGDLTVDIGSDKVVDIGFVANTSVYPEITSGGVSVTYQVSLDGLLLTAFTDNPATPVFTVQISTEPNSTSDSTLQYTFTLLQSLDQLDVDGLSLDPLPLSFQYSVTDYDGDKAFSSIDVAVSDEGIFSATGDADELQLSESPSKALVNVPTEGTIEFSLTASKDPIVDARFEVTDGDVVVDASSNNVTQNGSPLTWFNAGENIIQIRAVNGSIVVEFMLPEVISIEPGTSKDVPLLVSVLQQIDHFDSVATLDNITIPIGVTFIDSDLTKLTLPIKISILDGLNPSTSSIQTLAVDEDNIVANTANAQGLGFGREGSDTLTGFNVSFGVGTNLFSNGDAVALAAAADVDGWWVGSASGTEVFRVKFELDGSTDFVLSGPLDHADGSGENDLPINFAVSVNDADGDISNEVTMVVNVTDDIPIAKNRTIKLTEGADKNINVLKNGEAGADGGVMTKVTYDAGAGAVDYTFLSNPEVIDLIENGAVYGTLTIYQDGRIQVETDVTLSSTFLDSFDFEVTDFDGDIQVNTVNLNVQDEQASIQISPLLTDEDTTAILTVVANPGDLDDGESIASISFALAGLQGGSLTLGGVALPVDGSGNPVLSGANLVVNNVLTAEVSPNGVLEFTPALNTSDPTNQVVFNVVVTVDSNSGQRTTDDSFDFSVAPIVDAPIWDSAGAAEFEYNLQEDDGGTAANIFANLFDVDGSESLSYRIEGIAVGLILTAGGNNVSSGQVLSSSQMASLTIAATENLSGQFFFNAIAVAKENSTGDTQELVQQITVNIAPIADTPTLSTFNVSTFEDVAVDLSTFISGALADTDGSESLVYELEVPAGWQVVDGSGNEVGLQSAGVYRVTDVQVQANLVFLMPLEDISSINGTFSVDVTAISVELSVGVDVAPAVTEARSATRTVSVEVEGVVDLPAIGAGPDGLWSFDGTNITATVAEDSLIPLNFTTGTEDDDGSEVFDFVLRDLSADVAIVDAGGNTINLPVLGVFNNLPQYAVSATQLASLYLQPADDFSGQLTFQLLQTNTEPDGDSGTYTINVDISINPVVDTDNGISSSSVGGEDRDLLLNIKPPFADSDGSETLTNTIILSLPAGVKILFDFVEIDVPVGGLDLNQLAVDNGTTFNALINSGSLRVRAPEDSDADFTIPVEFEITDTSGLGVSAVQTVSGSLAIDVRASVDDSPADGITRIETPAATLTSTGGSITLDGAASFTEEDIDGSEYLDYIAITITNGGAVQLSGLFVSHPNGAINDGNGNWLIPADGLTSTSLVDTASQLLNGVTITSDQIGIFEIVVSARVLDRNDDADIIEGIVNVDFVDAVTLGSANAVSILQNTIVDGQEEQTITIGEHVNSAPAGDGNDIVSYRVDAAAMPYGGIITGADVIAEYAVDGSTVIAFVFTNASLASLAMVGINEDFAGAFELPVNKVSTDPLGATLVTLENLSVQVAPVVDNIGNIITNESLEDIPLPLQYSFDTLLTDSSIVAAEGIEQITGIKFVLAEGSLSGPPGVLTESPLGTYTVIDIAQLDQVNFIPPANRHGTVSFDVELTIEDTTTDLTLMQVNPAISVVTQTVTLDIIAVTDSAPIFAINQVGSNIIEDTDISFTGLFVVDIDNDGSETLTMQMLGVPAGAILLWDSGSGLQQLVNSGGDVANGFTWTFDPSQLNGLVLRPSADFAGDIELSLQSTSMELSTLEVVTVVKDFTVAVLPDADDAYFYNEPSDAAGTEGNVIQVDVFGSTQELVNANETVVLSIVVDGTTSDATALDGLVGIRTPDGKSVNFVASGSNFIAVIATSLSQLENFEFIAGSHAHGSLAVEINIGSKDSATVNGVFETDITDNADFQSRNITIDITPEPDVPILTLTVSTITSGEGFIPLGLSLEQINPATAAGETADIVITGLPEGVLLSDEAVQSGASWIVAAEFVEGLVIKNADIAPPFSITIEARSTLNGVTVVGGKQSLAINIGNTAVDDDVLVGDPNLSNLIIGGLGDDTMTGALLKEDTYLFRAADIGLVGDAALDTITNFGINLDHIDLSDIPGSLNSGVELDTIIDLNEATGTTTLTIDLGAGLVQSIVLDGASKDDLFGSSSWSDDADILTKMLQDQVLLTG